jgi:magnesium-transporting ATPase (P-type)
LVKEDQKFPADLILLSTNTPNGNAFIETASLDGEKNLKPRSAYPQTQKFSVPESFTKFKGVLDATDPKGGLE